MRREKPVIIADQAKCIRILTEHSLLDKCRPHKGDIEIRITFEHEDCWGLATYVTGRPTPDGNGYFICLLPKHLVSEEKAKMIFLDIVKANTGSDELNVREFRINPEIN